MQPYAPGKPRIEVSAVRTPGQIAVVAQLAHEIWIEHYTPIIGRDQVDYMLANFQSEAAIAAQLAEGYEYFLLGFSAHGSTTHWAGYCAAQPQPLQRRLFVSKLYVSAAVRGRGLGRAGIDHLLHLARERALDVLWLTVNKHNPTLQQYLRWGFINVGAVVADIGGGYVMDDFKLEMPVK